MTEARNLDMSNNGYDNWNTSNSFFFFSNRKFAVNSHAIPTCRRPSSATERRDRDKTSNYNWNTTIRIKKSTHTQTTTEETESRETESRQLLDFDGWNRLRCDANSCRVFRLFSAPHDISPYAINEPPHTHTLRSLLVCAHMTPLIDDVLHIVACDASSINIFRNFRE